MSLLQRCLGGLALLGVLVGCTHLPGPDLSAGVAEAGRWQLAGRFAAGSDGAAGPGSAQADPVAGRFSWQHQAGSDELWLIGPLGNVMAKVEILPTGVRWQDVTGKRGEATDVRALGEALAGIRLPDAPADAWLRGRWPATAVRAIDSDGAVTQAESRGWQFDYRYGVPAPRGWPLGIEGRGPDGLWLRIALTEWNGRQDPAESITP